MNKKDYQDIIDRMKADAFQEGYELSVLVENFQDEIFWSSLIENAIPELIYKIDFPYYSSKGAKGKSEIKKFKDYVSKDLIICVDSDIDLYNKKHWMFNKFIYQTFVYSIENYICSPRALSLIFRELTTNNYNFENVLKKLSNSISRLFYLWISLDYKKREEILNIKQWETIFKLNYDNSENFDDIIEKIKEKITNLLNDIKVYIGETEFEAMFKNEIPELEEKISEKFNINKNNLYYFIHGKTILNEFVKPFFEKLINFSISQKKEEIKIENKNTKPKVLKETLQHFDNISNQDINTKINDNYKYVIFNKDENFWMKKIFKKLQNEL